MGAALDFTGEAGWANGTAGASDGVGVGKVTAAGGLAGATSAAGAMDCPGG
jgi:hypothetical protein